MPGAGGIKAATYIERVAPQDGTAWGFITRGFMLAPLLKLPQADFQPAKFNWIGSPARTVSMGLVWNAHTPVRTIQDAMQREVVVGATSIAQDTGIYPRALNQVAGTKFKIVTGYAGLGAVDIAMQRGEVQGKVGSTWGSLNSGSSAHWVKDKIVTVLVQLGVKKSPDIPADVPLGLDLAKNAGGPAGARSAVRAGRHRLSLVHGPGRAEGARGSDPRGLRPRHEGSGIRRGSCASKASTSIRSAPTSSPPSCAASMRCRKPR